MGLIRKNTLYTLAMMVWGIASAGVVILTISGNARPWLAPSDLPVDGPLAFFGVVAGLWLTGAFVINRFQRRSWKQAGRRAQFTPQGGSLFGYPDLVGNVDGRSVRAHTVKRKRNSGGESGSTKVTYTIVETDLAAPTEDGLMLGMGGGDDLSDLAEVNVSVEAETVGDVAVLSGQEGLAREVITGQVEDALRQPSRTNAVLVGDVTDVFLDAVPDVSGSIMGRIGSAIESKFKDGFMGDTTTVRTQTKGAILDGTELARQAETVATVANAYEAATADRPTA